MPPLEEWSYSVACSLITATRGKDPTMKRRRTFLHEETYAGTDSD